MTCLPIKLWSFSPSSGTLAFRQPTREMPFEYLSEPPNESSGIDWSAQSEELCPLWFPRCASTFSHVNCVLLSGDRVSGFWCPHTVMSRPAPGMTVAWIVLSLTIRLMSSILLPGGRKAVKTPPRLVGFVLHHIIYAFVCAFEGATDYYVYFFLWAFNHNSHNLIVFDERLR